MEKGNEYQIPINGLALGNHSYHFDIKDDFFEGMDYSEIHQGTVFIDLDIEKTELMMTLNFALQGKVRVACDRCADEFDISIENNEVYYVKFGSEVAEESDDVIVVPADQHDFDISSLIYEYIILSIPIHRVHPEGECNPEVLQMLSHEEEPVAEEENETDPRWAALKNIKLD